MAKAHLQMIFMAFLLAFFTFGCGAIKLENGQVFPQIEKTWCVAKPSTDDNALADNINYACKRVDCSVINVNGMCEYPNSPISHASVAMNAYYREAGEEAINCDFNGSGLIAITDPSYDQCQYA